MSLPYGLDAWFPLIAGELDDPIVLGLDAPLDAQALQSAWNSCRDGQALVIVDAIHGSLKAGVLGRIGKRSLAARFERSLAAEGRAHRWLLMPSTGGSHVLVPPSAAGFRAGTPILPAGRPCWRVARRLLQMAAGLGFANRFGFGELLVAVKGTARVNSSSPWMAARSASCVAISLGVPGYLRKATLRVCGAGGRVEGFLKVAMGPGASPRVAHEAQTLRRLGSLILSEMISPHLLDSGSHAESAWMVQTPVTGERSPDHIGQAHVAFLAALAQATGTQVRGQDLPRLIRSREHLDSLAGLVDGDWLTSMNDLHRVLSNSLSSTAVPCALSHGDFTPWNLSMTANGTAAFDWEFADWQAPILSDLIHFHLQTGILVRRVGAAELLDELEGLLAKEARPLLAQFGLDSEDGLTFIALEVLRAATDDEALNQKECPAFAQVDWLRDTRQELATRLSARLRSRLVSPAAEVLAA